MRKFVFVSVLSIIFTVFFVSGALAHTISEIAVNVKINDDGSARIAQTWRADIEGEGTEFYIPQGSLGDMEIKDFSVTGEDGVKFINEGLKWDPKRSASQKKGRCGIVKTDSGFELCWGIGDPGPHTYKVEWTFTNFVKAYKDYDGFNVKLVNDSIKPSPKRVSVVLEKPDYAFKSGDVDMWAFGYKGTIFPVDGKIVAESAAEDEWSSSNYLTVMLRFKKGLFDPSSRVDNSFSSLAERALYGTHIRSGISKVNMVVLLTENGSARMVQRWNAEARSGNSEFSILLGHLGGMEIKDFSVEDERTGKFAEDGHSWDKSRTMEEKTGRCGIVTTDKGTELCWGRGEIGSHTYTIKWTQTNVVKAFDDSDGLDLSLFNSEQSFKPSEFKAVVAKSNYKFKDSDAKVWSFDSGTTFTQDDGKFIVSLTPKADLNAARQAYIRIMMKFNKGLFNPSAKVPGTFDSVIGKEITALKVDRVMDTVLGRLLPILIVLFVLKRSFSKLRGNTSKSSGFTRASQSIAYDSSMALFSGYSQDNKQFKDAPWSREIPFGGDIRLVTFAILNTPHATTIKKTSMAEAYFLRLIHRGVLLPEKRDGKDSETTLTIVDSPGAAGSLNEDEEEFFSMLRDAAGDNGILEKNEFKKWGAKSGNSRRIGEWMASYEPYGSSYFIVNDLAVLGRDSGSSVSSRKMQMYAEQARRMELSLVELKSHGRLASLTLNGAVSIMNTVGFRKYLLDFTLLNERHAVEVELWNDYLVLAAAFNCAKQVSAELVKLKPDFVSPFTEVIASDMEEISEYTTVFRESFNEYNRYTPDTESYSSSSGGSSYSSGGGGSSGGGSGGGIR